MPRTLAMDGGRVLVALGLLSAALALPSSASAADLENGDFVVGVAVPTPTDSMGQIARVRNGVAMPFCTAQSAEPNLPDFFFNTPSDVVLDAQGRVVFLAYLGSNFDYVSQAGWGLWRCDSLGAAPTLLGAFGSSHPYASPLGVRDVRIAHGLHLKVSKSVDLNSLTVANAQLYVFAVGDSCCGAGPHDTIAYDPATSQWDLTFEPPVPTAGPLFDMINAGGYTFSVAENGVRAFAEPLRLDFQIGNFNGGVALQGLHDLIGAVVDNALLANLPNNCPAGPIANATPYNESGSTINAMAGFDQVAWADGLLIQTNNLGPGHAFLPEFSLALVNLDPFDDVGDKFQFQSLGCAILDAPKYVPWHALNSYSDTLGTLRNVTRLTPNGSAGTQNFAGRIVGVGPAQDVAVLAQGLNNPTGIDVVPGFIPSTDGVALFFEIGSPVHVLITTSDGRRIGADLSSGAPINDFADAGYDSQTDEPRIYGIRDPLPGPLTIETQGTGVGPYHIEAFGLNLQSDVISVASFSGNASVGSGSAHGASVSSGGVVIADADADGVADAADNCAFAANPLQEDRGGIGAGSAANGRGDACECGDVTGDGRVTTADAIAMTRSLLVPPTAALAQPQLCHVGGSAGCTTADATIVTRALLVPPTAQIAEVCAPALP